MKSTRRITKKERLFFIEKLVCGFSTYAEVADELKVPTKEVRKWHREYEKQRLTKAYKMTQASPKTDDLILLKQRIKDLENHIADQNISVDFWKTMINVASNEIGLDLKKNSSSR
ncbi:hypothetical protein [Persicobacter psychrovividus]|uniref:Transposase n=1 Tax=Persicobacter psychrovividus TaxID=387638 RepID=A0ABN6LGE6_9BACT|nr:hypothetical protein PEPS_43110 [Persicobacter psychrovividus]